MTGLVLGLLALTAATVRAGVRLRAHAERRLEAGS